MTDVQHAKELFIRALEVDVQDRDEFLVEACKGDDALLHRVRGLLDSHQAESRFLPIDGETAAPYLHSESEGDIIDRYKLLENIGEGGFGTVWAAEQKAPVTRKVALKLVKLGMDTRQVVARFEAERQALAMMEHPNIAKVLDGGATASGRPYFVMELVRGIPITEYCDQQKLTTEKRIELVVKVCGAVQHAHQKGIIHRDLKPSNILVTLHDGIPVPKIIDFGIAKATQQELTDKTIYTKFHQFIGTPAYISPEQAEMSGLDVDTRSDIYSLGVLLYELLTGETPFDRKQLLASGLDEVRRIIRHQDPLCPSTKFGTLEQDSKSTAAQRRSVEAWQLIRELRGDVDWIVMKCLEKDRTRRYETANELAKDLSRHLASEAVEARPPSAVYRLRKFAGRNRVWLGAISAVIASLLVGLAVASYSLIVAERRRQELEVESARSAQVIRVLNEMLEAADPATGKGDYTVREMLDEFSSTLDGRFDPNVEAEVRRTVGRAYYHLGLHAASERHLQQALALLNGSDSQEEAVVMTFLAETVNRIGARQSEAEALLRRAIEILKQVDDAPKELAHAYAILGWTLYTQSGGLNVQLAKSENESVSVNSEGLRLLEPFTDPESQLLKGKMCVGLSFELIRSGPDDLSEATAYTERAVNLLRDTPYDVFSPMALNVYAGCQWLLGNHDRVEPLLHESMPLEKVHHSTPLFDTLHFLLASMFRRGAFDEAINFGLDETDPQAWPDPTPPMCVRTRAAVSFMLLGLGDFERAEQVFRATLEKSEANLGPNDMMTLVARYGLVQALIVQRHPEKQDEAQEILTQMTPIGRRFAADGRESLVAAFLFAIGNCESPAADDLQMALQSSRNVLTQTLLPCRRLRQLYAGALVHRHAGDIVTAKRYLREIIESPTAYVWDPAPDDAPFYILRNAEDLLAGVLLDSGDKAGAIVVYREAITRREAAERPDRYQILLARYRLGKFLLAQGQSEQSQAVLTALQHELTEVPRCFEWLNAHLQKDLASMKIDSQLSDEARQL